MTNICTFFDLPREIHHEIFKASGNVKNLLATSKEMRDSVLDLIDFKIRVKEDAIQFLEPPKKDGVKDLRSVLTARVAEMCFNHSHLISSFHHFTEFNIQNNPITLQTTQALTPARIKNLSKVNLFRNYLTDTETLKYFLITNSNITYLNLSRSGCGLPLVKLPKLKLLNIKENVNISEDALTAFSQQNPEARIIKS